MQKLKMVAPPWSNFQQTFNIGRRLDELEITCQFALKSPFPDLGEDSTQFYLPQEVN